MKLIRYVVYTLLSFLPGVRYVRTKLLQLEMYLDVKTPGISKSLFVNRTREDDMVFLIDKFMPKFGDLVDCGSNIGFYPLLERKLSRGNDSRRIICVEPDPRNLCLLNKNISTFGDTSFTVIHGAVSEKNGTMKLDVSRESNLNYIVDSKACNTKSIDVETVSLDNMISRLRIDATFLRMDIEGHEIAVFEGAKDWARTSQIGTTIIFETHSPMYRHPGALLKCLMPFKEAGFKVKCIVSSGGRGGDIKRAWGLRDGDMFKSDGFEREIFWDVDFELACEIASASPKLTRYMLIIKEARA